MKRILFGASVFSLLLASCSKDIKTLESELPLTQVNRLDEKNTVVEGQYIVQLETGLLKSNQLINLSYEDKLKAAYQSISALLSNLPGEEVVIEHVYVSALNGFAAGLSPEQVEVLRNMPGVLSIENDAIGSIVAIEGDAPRRNLKSQSVEYGVLRTGRGDGTGKRAWIIDTGIDLDHEDLNVNEELSRDFTADGGLFGGGLFGGGLFGGGLFGGGEPAPQGDDDNGHGTHCAGIVAAIDNNLGVVGVAANAEVVALKCLNFLGNGNATDVIQCVDYVAANGSAGDVANLSLSFIGTQNGVNIAVQNLAAKGIFVTIAAGNNSQHASNESPAMTNGRNIFTVSAMDENDNFASFSNHGNPPVDFCAPGVNTYSTYINNGYGTLSGTSMAAPHLAGLLLLTNGNLNTDGVVNNDRDSNPDPIAHL